MEIQSLLHERMYKLSGKITQLLVTIKLPFPKARAHVL